MRQSGRVKTAYMAEYADPIVVRAGETLAIDDRMDTWDGNPEWVWVWCSDPRGRQGWVPRGWIAWEGERAAAARDYAATELTVAAGEAVTATEAASGWLWCTDQLGHSGWVPAANVELDSVL